MDNHSNNKAKIKKHPKGTPEEIQDEIFRKMSAGEKIKMVSQFFRFGKKLNKLNDRKI